MVTRRCPSLPLIENGEGVALGRSVLVADELASGRLIKPFDVNLPVEFAHYVVSPQATKDRPKIKAFREWLLQEARDTVPGV